MMISGSCSVLPHIEELPRDIQPATPDSDDDDDDGKHFHSVKPWIGNAQPPSWWDRRELNTKVPNITLELDYVYGYRSRQAHNNLHWVDEPTTFLYHAASVCVLSNLQTRRQRFFLGHKDDVLCLAYCPKTRLAASGGLGANATAPLLIWDVDSLALKQNISGVLQFGVVAVCFSVDGSRVFGIGDDNMHTIAMYDVGTGVLIATSPGDRNKLVHIIPNSTAGYDSRRCFVTLGVNHVKFWEKVKAKEEIQGKRAIGGDLCKQTMVSGCCTVQYVIVGNTGGGMYVFSDGLLMKTVQAHDAFVGALFSVYNTVYSGGRDGLVKQWNCEKLDPVMEKSIDLNPHSVLSSGASAKKQSNGPRALSVANDRLLVGTQLGSIYFFPNEFECVGVLEGHFDSNPGSGYDELWGMDVHPSEPLFCTTSDDATLRLWSTELGTMILMTHVSFPSRAVAFSSDGMMICVGHQNGAFSVWDSMTLTPILPFTRKREEAIGDVSFSPDGRFLAMALNNVIDVYFVKRNFEYIGTCQGPVSQVLRLDWSRNSNLLQCTTTSYEVVRFSIPKCDLCQSPDARDEVWASQRCVVGWPVQGIWEGCSDGTDVNSCGKSLSGKYLCVGYDMCRIRVFNYPCLVMNLEGSAKPVFPEHREYGGHSSHITEIQFTSDDRYVLSAGGADLTVLRWRVVPVAGAKPGQTAAGAASSSIAEDVAQSKIRELGTSTRRTFIDEQRYVDTQPGTGLGTGALHGRAASAAPAQRRPFSGNSGVKSKLFERTASAQAKAELGMRQREHIEKEMSNLRRFQTHR
jgi:WD40 repeat protein